MKAEDDILIVDDEIPNLKLLTGLLEREGYAVRPAELPQLAIDSALAKPPLLILMDVKMPEMSGFEVCRLLKQDERTRDIPIIFISSLNDAEDRVRGFDAGGVDFIFKPFQEQEVLARVRTHTDLRRMQLDLGRLVDERTSELRESKERYELAVAGSAAGLWDWDISRNSVFFSDRFKEFLGYTSGELTNRLEEFWDRLHPEDVQTVRQSLDRHLQSREVFDVDCRLQTKSGEYKWFHARGQALWDEKGDPTRMSGSINDITERKQAEEGLRQSREFNQSVLMSLTDHIAVLDRDGTILTVNTAWQQFARENDAKFPEGVGPGVNYLKVCQEASINGDDSVARALTGIRTVLDGDSESFDLEYPCHSPTAERWFLMTVSPFKGLKGGVIVAHINITSRKLADEALEDSRKKLMKAERIARMGFLNWNLKTNEIVWSREIYDLYGVDPGTTVTIEQTTGMVHPGDRELVRDNLDMAIQGIRDYDIDHRIVRPDGKVIWVHARADLERDREGTPIALMGTVVDITERKLAEEELVKSEIRFRELMEQSPLAIVIFAPDGTITRVNSAWFRLWDVTEEESAQVLATYNLLTDQQSIDLGWGPQIKEAFAGETVILPPFEYSSTQTLDEIDLDHIRGKTVWIQPHLSPVKDENGEVVFVVNTVVDITKLKLAEAETRRHRDALARFDRATSMGQLTGSIAHELNQPLTGILSNAQAAEMMINSGQWDDEELAEIMAEIVADTKRGSKVIHNLRDLYREQQGEYQPVDINAVVEETRSLLHSEFIVQHIVVTAETSPSTPLVDGNRIQIQQVLVNLIMNGVQAMAETPRDDRRLQITTTCDAKTVQVSVEDRGHGIDPEKIARIFEPLATWKQGGTGMGLAISNSIIEAHGGRMWAENKPDGGAIVCFAVPILNEEEQ